MRAALTGTLAALLGAALAGCGGADSDSANRVEPAGPDNTQNLLEALPEGQRNAVFIRAIQDAGQDCQHVEASARSGEHQGFPVWTARCSGGGQWTIVITSDGAATVLNAAEAQLVDGNSTEPGNAQGE